MNSEKDLWEEVRDYYYKRFGIAPELVDIAPVLDILRLSASGSSNKVIAEFFNEHEMGVSETVDAYLGFMGWEHNLSFSPLKIYKELNKPSLEVFKEHVVLRFGITNDMVILYMYNASVIVDKLERLFDEKWI
jgi:hypothetical protein